MTVACRVVFVAVDKMARVPEGIDDERFARLVMKRVAAPLAHAGGAVRLTAHRLTNKKRRQMFYHEMPAEAAKAHRRVVRHARKAGVSPPRRTYVGSKPGEPPRKILGLLTNNMLFGVDMPNKTLTQRAVRIGPRALRKAPQVPRVLEEGGMSSFASVTKRHLFVRRRKNTRKMQTHRIAPRPYMRVALERNLGSIARKFAGFLNKP